MKRSSLLPTALTSAVAVAFVLQPLAYSAGNNKLPAPGSGVSPLQRMQNYNGAKNGGPMVRPHEPSRSEPILKVEPEKPTSIPMPMAPENHNYEVAVGFVAATAGYNDKALVEIFSNSIFQNDAGAKAQAGTQVLVNSVLKMDQALKDYLQSGGALNNNSRAETSRKNLLSQYFPIMALLGQRYSEEFQTSTEVSAFLLHLVTYHIPEAIRPHSDWSDTERENLASFLYDILFNKHHFPSQSIDQVTTDVMNVRELDKGAINDCSKRN